MYVHHKLHARITCSESHYFQKTNSFFNLIASAETLGSNLMFISFLLSDRSAWGRWNGTNNNIFIVHRTVASEEDTPTEIVIWTCHHVSAWCTGKEGSNMSENAETNLLTRKIWGCASKSSQTILQKTQSRILRMITNAPRYVSNLTLHEDLKIPYVREVIFEKYAKHHRKLETHLNPLLHPLLDTGQPRRLKRTQPVDLLWGSRGSVIGRGIIMSLEECSALLLLAH